MFGLNKRPTIGIEVTNTPKTGQQLAAPNPQVTRTFGPQIAPATYKVARDPDDIFFRNYQKPNDEYEAPRGFHNVANYARHYVPNPGCQNMPQNNYMPEQANGQFISARINIDGMVNQIANVIQNQFVLKLKEQNYMYRHLYPE